MRFVDINKLMDPEKEEPEADGHLPNCSRSDRCPGNGNCK